MTRNVVHWTVEKLGKERTKISFPEFQREKSLWRDEKKSLLIDSILNDIDIPKLYFNCAEDGEYEVIDGQQRLWAIWDFLDDGYGYKAEFRSSRKRRSARKFSQLDAEEQKTIRHYKLQVTEIEGAEEEYLRELFLRLQLGLLLITGEKLHAASGAMQSLVFKQLASSDFIKAVGIPSRRFAKETLCAQICINSFNRAKLRSFARTRYEDLLHFFQEYEDPQGKDLKLFQERSKAISGVFQELWSCFGQRTNDLRSRSYILSVYLLFEELLSKGPLSLREKSTFVKFVFTLWKRMREEVRLGFDRKNRELYSFQSMLSSAPGEKYQIERRHKKLSEYYTHFKAAGRIPGD